NAICSTCLGKLLHLSWEIAPLGETPRPHFPLGRPQDRNGSPTYEVQNTECGVGNKFPTPFALGKLAELSIAVIAGDRTLEIDRNLPKSYDLPNELGIVKTNIPYNNYQMLATHPLPLLFQGYIFQKSGSRWADSNKN
ncbi:MAG: hypothetical protein D6728_05660, partial [Cyanobacteria bacterium J055]